LKFRLLRPLFERRRAWLGELCRMAARVLEKAYRAAAPGARPAFIEFVQTFGDLVNFHPHVHVLAADGVFRADGTFVPLPPIPEALLERDFRRAVLEFLVGAKAISEDLRDRMLGRGVAACPRRVRSHHPGMHEVRRDRGPAARPGPAQVSRCRRLQVSSTSSGSRCHQLRAEKISTS
jgi:hypothetical protein